MVVHKGAPFKLLRLFLMACGVLGSYTILLIIQRSSTGKRPAQTGQTMRSVSFEKVELSSPPMVLIWTAIFGRHVFEEPYGMCPNRQVKCLITMDKSLLKSANVVVFHARDLPPNGIHRALPKYKPDGQKWVLWNMEPPANSPLEAYKEGENVFDLDANYMHEAEIFVPYGVVKAKAQPEVNSDDTLRARFRQQKGAFWMVSNCKTESNRESYVRELSKHFPVDVYGSCGNLSCPKSNEMNCAKELSKRHMFYISFENSLCPDYVTEKLFRTLEFPIIPVVLSGPRSADLDSLNAYVDAYNYTPPKLAVKLREISENFDLYKSYFKWRDTMSVVTRGWYPFCKICDDLLSGVPLQRRRYNQVMRYKDCRRWDPSTQTFRNVL